MIHAFDRAMITWSIAGKKHRKKLENNTRNPTWPHKQKLKLVEPIKQGQYFLHN